MKTQLVLCVGGSLLAGMSACKKRLRQRGANERNLHSG